MSIIVRSPYSGRSVKVRDQDLGRAIRDEEGRVFYVVKRSEGGGYYASPTRQGSANDEQRYLELEAKVAAEGEPAAPASGASGAGGGEQRLHDATGPGRPLSPVRLIVLLLVLLLVIAAGLVLFLLPAEYSPFGPTQPPEQTEPVPVPTPTPGSEPVPVPGPDQPLYDGAQSGVWREIGQGRLSGLWLVDDVCDQRVG